MKIKCILAVDTMCGIGKQNSLPWGRIKQDMMFFKQKTINNIVFMGRNTFQSIGSKPLKDRLNIVISSRDNIDSDNLIFKKSLNDFLNQNDLNDNRQIFCIGGATIYNYMFKMDLFDQIFLTRINKNFDCDVTVNLPSEEKYNIEILSKFTNNNIQCSIEHWIKK